MTSNKHEGLFVRSWYQKSFWLYLLFPLAIMYWLLSAVRRLLYRVGILRSYRAPVPVVIVGNITVGGTGKTPLVIALCKALQDAGMSPGVVSRGYGGSAPSYPHRVTINDRPEHCGDEPLLIAEQSNVPVVVDANRESAIRCLLANNTCDVIIADDGLQHYALQRDLEIAVVDGSRNFGNRWLLPVGPLRESVSRLKRVDFIVGNGPGLALPQSKKHHLMGLRPTNFTSLIDGKIVAFDKWLLPKRVHAVAGIGNPDRFFHTLKIGGFDPIEHSFPDHHHFTESDLIFSDEFPVVMTAKDAVKARALNKVTDCWYLSIEATVDNDFFPVIKQQIKTCARSHLNATGES
jgi:tetraacyldisaccharide 4'-kinase